MAVGIRFRCIRLANLALVVSCAVTLAARPARAEEHWTVRSGNAYFNFNVELLRDLGIEIVVEADRFAPHGDVLMLEEPSWAFPLRKGSDLGFRSEHGMIRPGGLEGSALRLDGAITLRDRASGRETRLDGLEIGRLAVPDPGPPGRHGSERLQLRSSSSKLVFCDLVSSMLDFRRKNQVLQIHYLNARITESWARAIGRPELAGWVIGGGEVRAAVKMSTATPSTTTRYQPKFAGGILDVSLGALEGIQQVGHVGIHPSGTVGLSMNTTSCNVGQVDVPWLSPMQEDHPLIHMALYRLLNGRFEQIGVSWMKHGFFALSDNQCSTCQNPSDGTYLAIGCSDTYDVSNNSNRTFLGPRNEVNPYAATWECTGSHFSGGIADCTRRHTSSGHNAVEHRLVAADADLANAGATYYYESCYYVRNDENLANNWGSRRCTMTWSGSTWDFSTPSTSNPLLEGPALVRWGELATTVDAAAGDGQVMLAVQTTDLGGGTYHYEYALLNRNSDRQIRSFSLPVNGVANITNIGFHDNDNNASTDWTVSVENGTITWQTSTFAQDPNAPALVFGNMVNFRFDADAAPTDRVATLGLFKPGTGTDVGAATRGPMSPPTAVEDVAGARPRLVGIRPNPFNRSATISFELASAGAVRLEIYDAAGRLVRRLIDEGREAGLSSAVWDGNTDSGARAHAGVYHARLRAGRATTVKSLILVN